MTSKNIKTDTLKPSTKPQTNAKQYFDVNRKKLNCFVNK